MLDRRYLFSQVEIYLVVCQGVRSANIAIAGRSIYSKTSSQHTFLAVTLKYGGSIEILINLYTRGMGGLGDWGTGGLSTFNFQLSTVPFPLPSTQQIENIAIPLKYPQRSRLLLDSGNQKGGVQTISVTQVEHYRQ